MFLRICRYDTAVLALRECLNLISSPEYDLGRYLASNGQETQVVMDEYMVSLRAFVRKVAIMQNEMLKRRKQTIGLDYRVSRIFNFQKYIFACFQFTPSALLGGCLICLLQICCYCCCCYCCCWYICSTWCCCCYYSSC